MIFTRFLPTSMQARTEKSADESRAQLRVSQVGVCAALSALQLSSGSSVRKRACNELQTEARGKSKNFNEK